MPLNETTRVGSVGRFQSSLRIEPLLLLTGFPLLFFLLLLLVFFFRLSLGLWLSLFHHHQAAEQRAHRILVASRKWKADLGLLGLAWQSSLANQFPLKGNRFGSGKKEAEEKKRQRDKRKKRRSHSGDDLVGGALKLTTKLYHTAVTCSLRGENLLFVWLRASLSTCR